MAVSAYAIVTLTEVKNFIKISTSDTTLDSMLETWIDRASKACEDIIGNKIAVQSITGEIHDGDGSEYLYPKYYPVTQISTASSPASADILAALVYRTDVDSAWAELADDADHILTDVDWDYIRLATGVFPAGVRNIKVTYKAGWSVIPGEVWRVCMEMVAFFYRESAHGDYILGMGSSSVSEAGVSHSRSYREMWKEWENRLRPFKRDRRKGVTLWR